MCPQISNSLRQSGQVSSRLHKELELQNINSNNEETKSESDDRTDNNAQPQWTECQSTFSFRNFEIIRRFSYSMFIVTIIKFIFFPITIIYQTVRFIFKSDSMLPDNVDFSNLSNILYY